jgi:O-antigen ligase
MRATGETKGPVLMFAGVGILVSIYAIAQHFYGFDLVRPAGQKVIIPMDGVEGRYLAIGTFCHHLTYAHLYQFIFLLLFTFVVRHPKNAGHLLKTFPAATLVGLSLAFSYSRAVWISSGIGAVLVVLLLWGKRGALLAAVSVGVFFLVISTSGTLGDRLRSVASREANVEREIIFRSHWDAIRDHPFLGIGAGRYEETMMPYYNRYDPPELMPRVHAHNNFLQIWLNAGILGLAGFLWINIAFFRGAAWSLRQGLYRRPIEKSIVVGGSVGIFAFLLSGLTQYNLGDSEVAMGYWFVMGTVLHLLERARRTVRHLDDATVWIESPDAGSRGGSGGAGTNS